jgi:acyl carrier protein
MIEQVKEVFSEVLGADPSEVTMDTTIDNLLEWDSLRHLELVTNLEKKFQVKFKMKEIIALSSVKAIITIIQSKGSS